MTAGVKILFIYNCLNFLYLKRYKKSWKKYKVINNGGTHLIKIYTISFLCLSLSKLYPQFILTNGDDLNSLTSDYEVSIFHVCYHNSQKSWLSLTNPTKPTCEVRIVLTYKHIVKSSINWCETLNTLSHDQHYWAWIVDINGGWPDRENLIACGSMDLEETLIRS